MLNAFIVSVTVGNSSSRILYSIFGSLLIALSLIVDRPLITPLTVGDSPPFGGRGIPFYLSQFVSILGNLYPNRGIKGSFLGMFGKMDLCKKILIQAYTSLI